ncbi:MAG: V-type ATP synthase subunit I [Prolixibacteraceae bacterium]|nr:V-type ATP synthase subunit I [Prolixibacteraceae bacterium]
MMKYSFLVYHADYLPFLKDLKDLGVLHIEVKKHEPTPEIQDQLRAYKDILRTIQRMKVRREDHHHVRGAQPPFDNGEEVMYRIDELEQELEKNHHKISNLEKEAQQLVPWGDFSPEKIEGLREKGLKFRFLICRNKNFDPEWEKDHYIEVVNEFGGFKYFILIEKDENEEPLEWPGVDELQLPMTSLKKIRSEQDEIRKEDDKLEHELNLIAKYCRGLLKEYSYDIKDKLDEDRAVHQTEDGVENLVKIIEGWVPKPKIKALNTYLEGNKILYVESEPTEEDKVPVLLKNDKFSRVFETIGGLYELPNYRELDLVPFFAPFYMMFFGFSLGDAGYGLIILAVALFLRKKKPKLKSIMTLASWLGLATVIFGILTGTFFGIDLINSEIPWLENWKQYMIDTDKLFNLALILGAIQILFGMVLKIVNIARIRGIKYAFSTIGWLLLIIGSGAIYALKEFGALAAPLAGYFQNGVLITSGVFILLINNPKRNILMNFLLGLWDVYQMVTGLIGDLLSYIRLFALGVSSAILGFVFNELAMSLKPDNIIFGPLVMIIILLIGHGMTIFMAGLGAFVHPIRLTFVEFYKNAGFTGGGKPYMPFANKQTENK